MLISASNYETIPFFIRVAELAAQSRYNSRITFSMDMEYNDIQGVLKRTVLPVNRRLSYGTGISTCMVKVSDQAKPIAIEEYKFALIQKLEGAVILTYIWTLDDKNSLENAVHYFDAVITNYPDTLLDIVQREKIPLATPGDQLEVATASNMKN